MDVYVPARTLLYVKTDQNITLWNYLLKLIIYLHSVLTRNSRVGFRPVKQSKKEKKVKKKKGDFYCTCKKSNSVLKKGHPTVKVISGSVNSFFVQQLLRKTNTSGQSADPLHWPLTPADRSYLDWMVLTNFHIRPQHTETKAGHQSRVPLHLKVSAEWFKVLLLFLFILLIAEVQDMIFFI